MYLKDLLKLPKTIGFRVAAWYSGFFILSSLLLFLIAYFFLSALLNKQNYNEITLELNEISALYEIGGMGALKNFVIEDNISRRINPLLVRVADKKNKTRYISSPEKWQDFDLTELEKTQPNIEWIQLSAIKDKYILAVMSARVSRGIWIQVGMSCEGVHNVLDQFRKIYLIGMLPLFIIGLAGGMFLSYQTRRPIRNIIQTVQAIDIQKMKEMVPRTLTGDELDELAGLFNKMLGSIHLLIAGMKSSLDNVAHDLRTPLTRFRNISETALKAGDDKALLQEALEKGVEESEHILKMLNMLMDISEAGAGVLKIERKEINISDIIEKVADMYGFVAEEKGVGLHMDIHENLFAIGDIDRMSQALANILDNAVKFTPSGGQITIEAGQTNMEVTIKIHDTGVGISQEELPRIWERLYRGDHHRDERGFGLGLSLVKGIINAQNGRIEAVSKSGKGSTFIISLHRVAKN